MRKVSNLIGTIALAFVALFAVNVHAASGNVAQVGNQSYTDLQQAVTAAAGQTVKLLDNVELSATLEIPTGGAVTIDLNDKTITIRSTLSVYAINNPTGANVTIKNGKVVADTKASGVRNYGTMALEGITVEGINDSLSTIKNEETATLTIKDSTISYAGNKEYAALQNFGTATITGSTVTGNHGAIHQLTWKENDSTTTVEDSKLESTDEGWAAIVVDNNDNSGTSKTASVIVDDKTEVTGNIIIEKLGKFQSENDELTEKALEGAQEGASVVIPAGYTGDIPEDTQAKVINASGDESVIITFEGKKYPVKKGSTWEGTELAKALNAAKKEGSKNKNFLGYFLVGGKKVTINDEWNNNAEVEIRYNFTVKINGVEYTMNPGDTLKSLKEYSSYEKENKTLHFESDNGEFSSDTEITQNMNLTTYYTVTVTVNRKVYTLRLSGTEGEDTEIGQAKDTEGKTLADAMKNFSIPEGKNSVSFYNNNQLISADSKINSNITLTVVYNVKITFTDSERNTWSVIVPEGTSLEGLQSLGILSAEALKDVEGKIFKGFVNAETGEMISEDQAINENISVKAIYEDIKVEEPSVDNPNTFDGIASSVVMMIVSLVALVTGAIASKKSFN